MNWVDLGLIAVVILAVLGGFYRGFILGTLDLVNLIGSILLAFMFYPYAARGLNSLFPAIGAWLLPVAFLATMIVARIIIGFVTSRLAWLSGDANSSAVNRALGIVPGFVSGVIYATIISALLLALPLWDDVTTETRDSRIANRLSSEV